MTLDVLADVNWIAVAVATLAYFALGAAWYIAPPSARVWSRTGGVEVDPEQGPDLMVFVWTLVVYAVIATTTAMLALATGTGTAGGGAVLGGVVGVVGAGYLVAAPAVSAIYGQKPEPLNHPWVNGVFNLIGLVVVGAIIVGWR